MATQISSNCITNTSICNGTYACGGDTEMAVLARVVPLFRTDEDWDISQSYEALTIIRHNELLYISKLPVPCGIELDNCRYWTVYAQSVDWDLIKRLIAEGDEAVTEAMTAKIAEEAQNLIAAYTEADAELRTLIDAAKAAIDDDGEKIAELRADVNAASTAVSQNGAKIADIEAKDAEQDAEIERVSGNADALSQRIDVLEQNGGGGIQSLTERVTAVEAINESQNREIDAIKSMQDTSVEDIDSLGTQLADVREQQDMASDALDQLIARDVNGDEVTYAKGPLMSEWLGDAGGSGVTLPVPVSDGGTGATTRQTAITELASVPHGTIASSTYSSYFAAGGALWALNNSTAGPAGPRDYLPRPNGFAGNWMALGASSSEGQNLILASGRETTLQGDYLKYNDRPPLYYRVARSYNVDDWIRVANYYEVPSALQKPYLNAAMDGQDAWNHGIFVASKASADDAPAAASNYLPLPTGQTQGVFFQMDGEGWSGETAEGGQPVAQLCTTGNGMVYTRYLSKGIATTEPASWVRLATVNELPEVKAAPQPISLDALTWNQYMQITGAYGVDSQDINFTCGIIQPLADDKVYFDLQFNDHMVNTAANNRTFYFKIDFATPLSVLPFWSEYLGRNVNEVSNGNFFTTFTHELNSAGDLTTYSNQYRVRPAMSTIDDRACVIVRLYKGSTISTSANVYIPVNVRGTLEFI